MHHESLEDLEMREQDNNTETEGKAEGPLNGSRHALVALRMGLVHANYTPVPAEGKEIHLTGPSGTREIKIPEAGDFVLPPLDRVGMYTLDVPVPGYDKMAVNLLDSNESNLMPSDRPPGDIGDTQVATGRARVELWWWLAALAAPLLLIEWFVYTRRVHL